MRRGISSIAAGLVLAVLLFVPPSWGVGRMAIDYAHPLVGEVRVGSLADASRYLDFHPRALGIGRDPGTIEVSNLRAAPSRRGVALVYFIPGTGHIVVREGPRPQAELNIARYVELSRKFGLNFETRINGNDALGAHIPYAGVSFQWIEDDILFSLEAPDATDTQARRLAALL